MIIKKMFVATMFAVLSMSTTTPITQQTETVYICHGPKSHRYHKTPKCKGLCRCSTDIKKVTKAEAQAKHYTPCKICYR